MIVNLSILEFHGHEHYRIWYYVFTYFIGMFALDNDFVLKDKDLEKRKLKNYMAKDVLSIHELTPCGLMTPYGDTDLGQHWLR